MTRLPATGRPFFELRKLTDYCLNPTHPRGRHKARVFREALGLDQTDAEWLRDALLAEVYRKDAIALGTDRFGSRWRIDIPVARQK
jgi:hypothetical protein